MATTAVIGLSAGKRLLSSTFYYSDLAEKLSSSSDHLGFSHHQVTSSKNLINAKRSSNYSPNFLSSRDAQSIKAVKEHVDTASSPSNVEPWIQSSNHLEDEIANPEFSVDALLLLQKSMLEKQWNLTTEETLIASTSRERTRKRMQVTGSGTTARRRRIDTRRRVVNQRSYHMQLSTNKQQVSVISPNLLQNHLKSYVKGVISEELLTHTEVVQLSKIIKTGLHIEDRKSRLEERLGCEPSEEQLSSSLKISRAELQYTQIECSLAREKLAMSNVRLVMSIAQRYDNMGAEMADLVQGGLIGLLRGIEKFDSSKGFKISTYVYWWIRQGVSKALVENSRTLRLPTYLHERLSLIRNAKTKLEERGITPSIDKIAESLNMSQKKVRNATEAINEVYSLDREAFPSLNGLPGETLHSYIADNRLENNPWHGVDEWALKDEVNRLMNTTLRERERAIIRLYYGLDNECLTWEDISKRIGLSRERVRQVGLVALEKLKHAARKKRLEAMLGFDEKMIDVNRTVKVTKGGQLKSYTAIVACGNYHGVIGFAKAKASTINVAIQKAREKCFQNLHYVERHEEHTIAHAIQASYKKTKVYLWPGPTQSGMSAGRHVQTILHLAGFRNVKSKVVGSRNPHNTVKALFKALNAIETPKDFEEKFGRTVVESYLL